MIQPTVSAGLLRGLIDFAATQGADPAALIAQAGVTAGRLDNPDNRLPFRAYVAAMAAAKAATGNPALALHYAEQVGMSEVSVVGLIMEASATMGEAFLQLQRYGRLATEIVEPSEKPRFELAFRDGLFMVYNRPDPNAFPELTEEAFFRRVVGPRRCRAQPHVLSVHVTHPAPSYRDEYDRSFQ